MVALPELQAKTWCKLRVDKKLMMLGQPCPLLPRFWKGMCRNTVALQDQPHMVS